MPTDIFDEIESPVTDVFDEIEYTPETPRGFGDLKVAELEQDKGIRRNALLEEQKRARFNTAFDADNLRAIETAEKGVQAFSQPWKGAIHGTRQMVGLEDPENPLPITPPLPRTTTENVKRFIPDAMPGVAEGIAGTQQAIAGLGDFFLDPDFVALGGAGTVPKLTKAALGTVFSGSMAQHIPEQAEILGKSTIEGKPEDIVREGINTGIAVLGTIAPIAHSALPKSSKVVEEKVKQKPSNLGEKSVEDFYRENPDKRPIDPKKAIEISDFSVEQPRQKINAKFIGEQEVAVGDPIKLYNIDKPILNPATGEVKHSANSTLSEMTLRENGIEIPNETKAQTPPALTQPGILPTVEKVSEPIAETITGSNEQKGSEMPAERLRRPKSVQSQERPWDLIDELESNLGGKLSLPLAKKLIEDFKPTGRLRKLFRSTGGFSPDIAKQSVEHIKQFGSDAEFLEALLDAAEGRKTWRKSKSQEKVIYASEEKQLEQFHDKAISGNRPKKEIANVEKVPVQDLLEGDSFEIQGNKFEVKELIFDEDGRLESLEVKDGPKFGVQTVTPDLAEFLHIDKGSLKTTSTTDFIAHESTIPKLRSMENQGDLLSKQTEDLSLVGEKAIDFERVQKEKEASEKLKAEAKAEQDKNQTGFVGMGGAVESEFKPSSKSATSIKNAQVEQERAQRGLPPAVEPARRSFGRVWDESMAEIDRDPGRQDRLISELRESPRSLTDLEDALLLHRQIDLQNEYGKATRDLSKAFDDGVPHLVELEKARVDRLSDQLEELYDINKKVGTETGRGLNARKMMANEDFSLASLTAQKRAAKGGKPLTTPEISEIQKIHDDYKAKTEAYEKSVTEKDQRISEMEAQRAYEQLKRETLPSNYVIQIAEKIVQGLEKRATKAEKELQAIFARTSAGVDPTILLKVTEIAAYHIAKHGLDFAKWSADAVGKFGYNVKPYLQESWDSAQKLIDEQATKFGGRKRSKEVTDSVKKTDSTSRLKTAKERTEKGEKVDIGTLANQLARDFIKQGARTRDELLDLLHPALQKIVPDITRRDAMDALSGYGDFKKLSREELDVQLRDLKGQMQQIAKLEDMQSGKAPEKTGVERRTPSDEERRLIKQVEEAKRKGGYKVTDPATQLKSALDAVKTRLRNSITDLESQIESKTKIVKDKRGVQYDAEANALRDKRDELKKEFDDIFGKRELTDEQRTRMAISAVERSITELANKIGTGDISPIKKPSKTKVTPELEAARAQRYALKEQLQELRDIADPKKTPEERALQSFKTRTKNKIAELEEQIAKGDFSKKKPVTYEKDTQAVNLKYELERVKRRWREAVLKDKLENRTTSQKVKDRIAETLLFQKAWKTAFDLSAIFRQGGFVALGNPIRTLKIMPDMLRAMKSEKEQFKIEEEIRNRPNALLYNEAKLFLSSHGEKLSQMEEAYLGRWSEKVPLVSHSSRAYTTFLNRLRADSFDALIASLSKDGKPTIQEAKAIANFVNVATGRGSVGPTSNIGVAGMNLFFAPRYVVSRFQLAGGQPFYKGSSKTRTLVAKEYAKFLIGLSVLYGLASSAGASIESDPRSSDFGKIKWGKNVIDPLSGISQQVSFIGKMASGKMKNTKTGQIQNIRGKVSPVKDDAEDIFWRYIRSKLAPSAGALFDVTTGKNFDKTPVSPETLAKTLLVPINVSDVLKIMKENGIPEGVSLSVINTAGMGVSPRKQER